MNPALVVVSIRMSMPTKRRPIATINVVFPTVIAITTDVKTAYVVSFACNTVLRSGPRPTRRASRSRYPGRRRSHPHRPHHQYRRLHDQGAHGARDRDHAG